MLLKIFCILLMLLGLVCTLSPKGAGILLIFVSIITYGYVSGFQSFSLGVSLTLIGLLFIGEVGTMITRNIFKNYTKNSPSFVANSIVENLAGLVVSETLFGSYIGGILWELVAGRPLIAKLSEIKKVFIILLIIALIRLFCGVVMVILAVSYIFI